MVETSTPGVPFNVKGIDDVLQRDFVGPTKFTEIVHVVVNSVEGSPISNVSAVRGGVNANAALRWWGSLVVPPLKLLDSVHCFVAARQVANSTAMAWFLRHLSTKFQAVVAIGGAPLQAFSAFEVW
eukprot:15182043-Alexandrium_andersonii.AAC.1